MSWICFSGLSLLSQATYRCNGGDSGAGEVATTVVSEHFDALRALRVEREACGGSANDG